MSKKTLSYIFDILFIAIVGLLTFKIMFGNQEFSHVIESLHHADKPLLLLGLIFVICFVCGESVIIKYMLHLFKDKTPLHKCIKYSFIGFFFSCITPSSSGGQPAQIIYMKKDGIKIGFSTLIMLVVTVAYKSVLVILGTVFLFWKHDFIFDNMHGWSWLLIVGYILNVAYVVGLVIIFFKPLSARSLGIKLINLLARMKIIRNNEKYINKIKRICDNYVKGAEYIKKNIWVVINVFIITVVQRLFLLAITFVVYKAYHLSGVSFICIVALQTIISIMVEMIPLPGAAGISEACFTVLFSGIFGFLVKPAMLLSRGLSFYFLLIISGIVTLFAHFLSKKTSVQDDN